MTKALLGDAPPDRDELAEEVESLRLQVKGLKQELRDANDALEAAKNQSSASVKALKVIRNVFEGQHRALQIVFGELDAAGIEADSAAPGTPVSSAQSSLGPPNPAAYNAWKQQLPPGCGKIIDALIVQPLSQKQMTTVCKMHYDTVGKYLKMLSANSLVNHDGRLYRLNRL